MPEDVGLVLVVDDDWMGRELLEAYLTSAGYRVLQANSGELALQMAVENPPDLVMLDVNMSGMDGFEVCARLRQNKSTQAVPVLMITALRSDADLLQADEVGANGFVTKPFDAATLLGQVAVLVQSSQDD